MRGGGTHRSYFPIECIKFCIEKEETNEQSEIEKINDLENEFESISLT